MILRRNFLIKKKWIAGITLNKYGNIHILSIINSEKSIKVFGNVTAALACFNLWQLIFDSRKPFCYTFNIGYGLCP